MRLKHLLSVFLTLLTLSVGQMWGTTSVSGTYKLVTSTTGIAAGDTVLLVNKAGAKALTGISTTNKKYGTLADVTVSSDIITLSSADVEELKVEAGNTSGSFSFKGTGDVSGYLNYSGSDNILSTNATKSNNTSWTLNNYAAANGMTIANKNSTTRILRFNSDRFACYTTNTGTLVNLYKKVYKVTYNGNGSTGGSVPTDANYYYKNASVTAKSNSGTLVKSGHTFSGWNTKADGSGTAVAATGSATFTLTYNTTLYAQWEEDAPAYTITPAINDNSYGGVSLSGVVVTATPNACYEYASPAYTVSPAGKATVTQGTGANINKFTVSNLSADVTITINLKAKAAGKTVNFDAGPGVAASTSLTEDCAGAGVTLPTVNVSTLCKGWGTFAGWRATAIAAADSSTTTNPGTLYAAGSNYKPSSDGETLYAVYSKVKSGGTAEETASVTISDYANAHSWGSTSSSGQKVINIDANITATASDGGNTGKFYTTEWRFYQTENATLTISAATGCTLKSATFTYGISNTGVLKDGNTTVSSGSAYPISGTSKTFSVGNSGSATNGQVKFTVISITYDKPSSTTYYCSDPNCCNDLGSITGEITLEQLTEGVNAGKLQASWPSQTTTAGWASPGIVINIYEDGNNTPVVTSEALANNTTSFSATSFTPKTCTQYYATLTALNGGASGYCAGDLVSDPSAKVTTAGYGYTNNSTNVNLVAALPASTCANGGADVDIQFTAATGYRLPTTDEEIAANVSVTNAGEKDEDWFCSVANDVLTISLSPSKATGNIGITVNGIVTVVPQITVSTDEINFNEVKKGTPTSTTFTVEGANLNSANITLSYSATEGDDDVFTFSKTMLIPSDYANPGIEITLTANTSAAGEYYGTITISDGNAGATDKTIDIYLTVLETYTVNWYVNGTKIDANSKTDVTGTAVSAPSDFSSFTDCVPDFHFIGWATDAIAVAGTTTEPELVTPITAIGTANVDYYAVFAEGTPASVDTLMYDAFTNDKTSDQSTAITAVSDNFTGSGKVYQGAYSTLKFGSSSDVGKITSKTLDLSDDFIVKMRAKKYSTDATTMYVKVGTDTRNVSTTDTLTGDFTTFTFAFEGTEETTIEIGVSNKRGYLDSVIVLQTVAEDFSMYYTTCPHVSRVTLSAPEVSNGSISFAQNSTPVTNVRTDGGEDVEVDVVPDPATGYDLTGVTLSGVAGASYAAGVITIPANAEGTLVATATFAQANYTVTMAQTGGASAELSADQTNKHYNDVITVTAEDKAGYVFKGWSASPAVTFANAKALETTFSMPNGNVTVTAAYAKVYTPAEALALDDLTDSVYVEGVISQVDEVSTQYKNATYWISADGTTTNQIKIYRGKHINKADVTADNAAQIAVGNKVRVRGKLSQSSNVNQFGQSASYITVLVEKTLSALTIVGDASVTTYDVGDSFDKTGLSLSATYNTGYVQANYTGTTITSNYDAPTTFTAGVTSVTVSAEEGLISTSRDIPVTVSSAVLDHVEISAAAQTEFWAKEAYKEPLLDAYLTDEPATVLHNVTGVSNTTGLDMSVTGNKSVTVTYTRKAGQEASTTYNFTVKPIAVDEANAHSVAIAREIIDLDNDASEDLDLELEANKTHVIGVVTSVSALTGTNAGKYTIVIKDQTDAAKVMTLYQVTLKSGITSVAQDDIIKAYGNLYYHSQSSKYEINTGGEVVAVVRTPNLTVADVTEMEINITADLGVDDLTIDKDGSNGDITFACTDPAVTIVNNKLHAAAAGDATVTATIAADGIYTSAETTFSVHVIAERDRYAITMDADGGTGTDPVYANQLAGATVDLPANNTYSKANSAFDAWVVTETESGDAVAVTNGHFTMPAAAVTIKATWNDVETCTISFRVSGEEVATADAPQTAAYSLAEVYHPTIEGFTWIGWSETEYDDETTTLPTIITSYTPALNEDAKTLYGIYSQVVGGASNLHYVLDYADEELGDNNHWGAYATAYDYTAADGGEWTIKAYKLSGMQINTSKSAYIKVPECPANIIQISLTCNTGAKNPVKFCATASDDATSLADGSNTTSQTLDLSSKSVTTGYIIPTGNCQITHIDVEYSGNVTYYTSSPVTRYNITYAKGDATGVTGLCEAQRKAAGTINLCDAPTCADKNFAKWSDGTSLYNAGAEYTLSADVTFTATWTPKPTYSVTYNTSGSTGTTPVDENEYLEGAEVTLASASGLSNAGYVFNGWSDGSQVYAAGYAEYAMPDHDVTFTATWAEISSEKWVLVTHEDVLEIDGEYAIVSTYEDNNHEIKNFALGEIVTMGSNKAGKGEAVTRSGNIVRGSTDMVTFTLKAGNASGQYAFKNGDNYLTWTSDNTLNNANAVTANSSWTITISETNDIATIANASDNTRKLQYNSSSPRFACYTSTQKAVQLFKKAKNTVVEDATETKTSAEVAGGDITVGDNGNLTINVSVDKQAEDLTVKNGGKLTLSGDKTLKVNNVYLSATMASGKSSQMTGTLAQLDVQGEVYFDITLGDNGNANKWHAFTVPFPVDAINGVYDKENNKLANEVNYAIMDYHGDIRATGNYGWKKFRGIMTPGTFYLMTVDGERTTYRFKKTTDGALAAGNTKALTAYSGGGADTDQGWNGVGNPTMVYGTVDQKVQVLNPSTYTYEQFLVGAKNFVVGTPFFVQATTDGTMTMGAVDGEKPYYAPARVQANEIKDIEVTFGNEEYSDRLYISASEEALNEYQIGKDLVKMTMTSTPKVAQIFGKAYNAKLCMVYAPMSNDQAVYDLSLYAPANGEYVISCQPSAISDQYIIYLTKDGNIIWNLTMSEYPINLNKGTTEGYGLLLQAKAPQTPTGVEQSEVNHQPSDIQKIIIDDNVFILRGGQMYDVTGKAVR